MNEARIHWHPLTSTDIHCLESSIHWHPLKMTANQFSGSTSRDPLTIHACHRLAQDRATCSNTLTICTRGVNIGVLGAFFRGGQQFLSAKTQSCSAKKISKPNKNGYKQTNLAENFIKYGGKGLCWPCFVSALSAFQFFSAKLTISLLPSHPIQDICRVGIQP